MFVNSTQHVHIVVSGSDEEGIVNMTCPACRLTFLLKSLECGGLRTGIGHVEERCHTAIRRRTALAFDVCLMCQSRLAEVNVVVDDARHCHAAIAFHYRRVLHVGHLALEYIFDTVIYNED